MVLEKVDPVDEYTVRGRDGHVAIHSRVGRVDGPCNSSKSELVVSSVRLSMLHQGSLR